MARGKRQAHELGMGRKRLGVGWDMGGASGCTYGKRTRRWMRGERSEGAHRSAGCGRGGWRQCGDEVVTRGGVEGGKAGRIAVHPTPPITTATTTRTHTATTVTTTSHRPPFFHPNHQSPHHTARHHILLIGIAVCVVIKEEHNALAAFFQRVLGLRHGAGEKRNA